MKKRLFLILLLGVLLCACSAWAESARVQTPGGKLNVRKTPEDKGRIAMTVPNHALVDVEENDGEWCLISYKGKTGYVRVGYLLLSAQLEGKTVYPDEGTLLLYQEPSEGAPVAGAAESQESVRVLEVKDGWARVEGPDGEAWADAAALSWQREEPNGKRAWIREHGLTAEETVLEVPGGENVTLPAGEELLVLPCEEERCLVRAGDVWGYLPASSVMLTPPEDTGASIGAITPIFAAEKANASLRRFKIFQNGDYSPVVAPYGDTGAYQVAYLDNTDQFLFVALVEAEKGKILFSTAYRGFHAPVSFEQLLPDGQVELTLSADSLRTGDILDAKVESWTQHSCAWSLEKDGEAYFTGEPGSHFAASFRPRESGSYRLTVTVADEAEQTVAKSADFTVTEGETPPLSPVYSQRDGWWENVPYRKSNLSHSGCAIFTLSHALQRMGFSGDDIRPENLAKTYALCLTPEGTNNGRLINEAAAVYGYTTAKRLITDRDAIAEYLRGGSYFTFSIARGHIALADGLSEDGNMVHVVDSAPTATFERISNSLLYTRTKSGLFRAVLSLNELDDARWFFETDGYGGAEYYLTLDYVAKRGVRLIQPAAGAPVDEPEETP